MADKDKYSAESLEALLSEETDEEFGLPEFKEHLADTLTPAVLKDWTAADFASIYVRFRPHLERHARKFLVNPSQVEEVVQDAFLYLMTTLPELDSELGVLRFLKWKVRLLALDVIRSNSRASIAPLDDQLEIQANLPDVSQGLERADDAAIVALALAKLQPRHREALIATLYEEKSIPVVAGQMGLSENAFRQLLFRARSAFKKALVGEAETQGKSITEILSIAARKAAAESGKVIGAAGAFLLVLAISIGFLPNLALQPEQNQAAPTVTQAPQEEPASEVEPEPVVEPEVVVEEPTEVVAQTVVEETLTAETVEAVDAVVVAPAVDPRRQVEGLMLTQLGASAVRDLSASQFGKVVENRVTSEGKTLIVTNGSGLTANIAYDLASEAGIQYLSLTVESRGNTFVAVPRVHLAEKLTDSLGNIKLRYLASDFLVGDTTGKFDYLATDKSALSASAVRLEVNLDKHGNVLGSTLYLTGKS